MKRRRKRTLALLLLLSIIHTNVYAEINEVPAVGGNYNDFLSYTHETAPNVSETITLNGGENGIVNFNNGAEIIAGESCIEGGMPLLATQGNLTINVGTAENANADLTVNGMIMALRSSGNNSVLTIDADENGRLHFTNHADTSAANNSNYGVLMSDTGAMLNIDAGSLIVDGKNYSNLMIRDGNADINLIGDFMSENGVVGVMVATHSPDNYNSTVNINAANITMSTDAEMAAASTFGSYGLYVVSYNAATTADVDLTAANKIDISGQAYGAAFAGAGNTIGDIAANDVIIQSAATGNSRGYGLYIGNSSGTSTHTLNLKAANHMDIAANYIGAYLTRGADLNITESGTVNIAGNGYAGLYSINAGNTDIAANNVNITSDYMGAYIRSGSQFTVRDADNVNITGGNFGLYADDGDSSITANNLQLTVDSNYAASLANGSTAEFDIVGLSTVTGNISSRDGSKFNLTTDNAVLNGFIAADSNGTATFASNGTAQVNSYSIGGNNGTVNLSFGTNSVWNGFTDDYSNIGTAFGDNHIDIFGNGLSTELTASGTVNVALGNNARWNLNRQSWVTSLNGTNSIVDLSGEYANALHIGTLTGSNTFVMNLNPNDLLNSDMLYIQNDSSNTQNIVISNRDEFLNEMSVGDKIRFATVGNSAGSFGNATIGDAGVFNVDFNVEYADYNDTANNDNENNDLYNGGANFADNSQNALKPGTDYVDSVYGSGDDAQNAYLVRMQNSAENISDAGKTIINMSRANYKNAIYMDRLNKRMGEMRYINGEEDQGMWVRLRHDRIGQSGDFRSMNTMYELGYDVKQPTDNGERRIGMAIDYMRGSTSYDDIIGKGETKRYGLWLYDTWLGEKGHYVDYVAKWGHLSNDFDITAKTTGEDINGDYSNNVFSVSAEYGKKNDMGNNWYFEPQAQLQLARVTGADYVTTQGSKVSVDGINSLIGRAGFRIGKDMSKTSTVYLKADVLHEFLGDQTVTASDATGTLREEFENKGTWYDVGFGFAAKTGNNSYAFIDFEKSFGNDNDETYQINAGLQWSF